MYSLRLLKNPRHVYKLQSYHTKTVYGYKFKPQQEQEVQESALDARKKQSNFYNWVSAYRTHGHKLASTNPVSLCSNNCVINELNENRYGLKVTDNVDFKGIIYSNLSNGTVDEAKKFLEDVYCNNLGYEFNYIENEEVKTWFSERLEQIYQEVIPQKSRKEIAELLVRSQAWDHFMATKFGSVKRYGGEGAESILPFCNEVLKLSANDGIENIVLGAAHRGKFNLLTGLLKCPPAKMFRKFKGLPEFPPEAKAMCDIASHFNASIDLEVEDKKIHVSMLSNPSHLEAVNPVAMGKTRAKQQTLGDGSFSSKENQKWSDKVLNILMHGDAAFAGQGINQECLMMTGTPHFEIGGTIHLIVNNQIGFTTPGERGRSTRYCTDLAKSLDAPVIHVNGDDPEAVCKAAKIAFDYQRRYRKDVFVDLNCFRRWGHNELDDPTFTNPSLYKIITSRKSVPDIYTDKLVSEGLIKQIEVDDIANEYNKYLNNELRNLDNFKPQQTYLKSQWLGIEQAPNAITQWDTGLEMDLLAYIGYSSVSFPENFNVHPKLMTNHIQTRLQKIKDDQIDWATAEAMAIGSLLHQGHNVRLSGEDVGRGTFSHRHVMLVDQKTSETHIPLNSMIQANSSKLEVANSILSEEAVLGFEYGMAIENPNNLIIWEAQFGDFFNGAQIIIDTFIASGETKWLYCNGLVMLLPHGYDGAGSEHSSCRMERFLQMTDSSETSPDGDDINMQVCQPTTPAQYFHLLRRQMIRNFRKPLVVVSPKTLLRLQEATSQFADMGPGTTFLPVLGDNIADPGKVDRVVFCSGKHYYALKNERAARRLENVAIIRIESLCPFPILSIEEELKKFKRAKVFIWSQEEHRNMGAWSFVKPRFENLFNIRLKYTGRTVAATPAVGVGSWHQTEVKSIISEPFNLS